MIVRFVEPFPVATRAGDAAVLCAHALLMNEQDLKAYRNSLAEKPLALAAARLGGQQGRLTMASGKCFAAARGLGVAAA